MAYKTLKNIYYKNKTQYQRELENRKDFFSAVQLPLPVCGNNSYFIPTVDLLKSLEQMHLKLIELIQAYYTLPGAAQAQYAKSCLLDEIKFTNDIEGIQSTRHEILAAYDEIKKEGKEDKTKRFYGLVSKYNKLIEGENIKLSTAEDIRFLYDEIIAPEIMNDDQPDGRIFRKESVSVVSPSQKIIHRGIEGEENIIKSVNAALSLLNNNDIPHLIKIAVLHYYIGYIHPFYDGNGRIDRFISSYLLSKTYDPLISYRLSYIIKKEKTMYYKAFDECNDSKNAGDLTPFILTFMDIVNKSIDNILKKVLSGIKQLSHYSSFLDNIHTSEYNKKIMYLLIQNKLFSNTLFDSSELGYILEKSNVTVKRNITKMCEDGLPVSIKKEGRKDVYAIDLKKLETYK